MFVDGDVVERCRSLIYNQLCQLIVVVYVWVDTELWALADGRLACLHGQSEYPKLRDSGLPTFF
jgi:hypothetical protein